MKALNPITLDLAWSIADKLAAKRGAVVARPKDVKREAVLMLLAAAHKLNLGGWDLAHAQKYVSVTLPGVPSLAADALGMIPYIGSALYEVAADLRQTTIYLSPAACETGKDLCDAIAHELGHADQIKRGGLMWCAGYGIVPEMRVMAEAPCYDQSIIVRHAIEGGDPHALCDGALVSLQGYGLGDDEMADARAVLGIVERTLAVGGSFRGPCQEVLDELRAAGCI
jgi:hypothetical protein